MPKHIHAELIKQWADDPSLQIQAKHPDRDEWYSVPSLPVWYPTAQYRIKPEPDPYAEFKQALAEGKRIQTYSVYMGTWVYVENALFAGKPEHYRVEPKYQPKVGIECTVLFRGDTSPKETRCVPLKLKRDKSVFMMECPMVSGKWEKVSYAYDLTETPSVVFSPLEEVTDTSKIEAQIVELQIEVAKQLKSIVNTELSIESLSLQLEELRKQL